MDSFNDWIPKLIESSKDVQECLESIICNAESAHVDLADVLSALEHHTSEKSRRLQKRINYRLSRYASPDDLVETVYQRLSDGELTRGEASARLSNSVYAGFQRDSEVVAFLSSVSDASTDLVLRFFTCTLPQLRES